MCKAAANRPCRCGRDPPACEWLRIAFPECRRISQLQEFWSAHADRRDPRAPATLAYESPGSCRSRRYGLTRPVKLRLLDPRRIESHIALWRGRVHCEQSPGVLRYLAESD